MAKGSLRIELFTGENAAPVADKEIVIRSEEGQILHRLTSDQNGIAGPVELDAPDNPYDDGRPNDRFYAYDVEIMAAGRFQNVIRRGVQIFEGVLTRLPVRMRPQTRGLSNTDEIIIPREHGANYGGGRFADDPESSSGQAIERFKNQIESMIVDDNIVIPNHIVVHLGSPNAAARNITVPFADYIKNVASSEIFPTWNESAATANILCQITFALNRMYTEWYRSRGRAYDMTKSIKSP